MTKKRKKKWSVYMVRCADGTLYTGISNDVKHRVEMHNKGKGAKYIIPERRPVKLVYVEEDYGRGDAMKREAAIKRAGKPAKEKLAKGERQAKERRKKTL
jgi:putative endonuclease